MLICEKIRFLTLTFRKTMMPNQGIKVQNMLFPSGGDRENTVNHLINRKIDGLKSKYIKAKSSVK